MFKNLKYVVVIIALPTMILKSAAADAQAVKAAVEVTTMQKGGISASVSSATGRDKVFDITLTNSAKADQNLDKVNVTITPDKLIPDGTDYLIGADEMLRREGNMIMAQTGKQTHNNDNNMYLMFRRDGKYLLVGVISWRTFLCQIFTDNGVVHVNGDGDNKLLKAGEKVAFEKVVVMEDASWQNLLDRYADLIVKENKVGKLPDVTWKGWATWDFYVQKFVPEDVSRNTKLVTDLGVGTNIIQIDGGWWKSRGDYFDVRDNIPGGIKAMTDKIHASGYKAGLHFDGYRVAKGSNIVKEHPEYFVHKADGSFFEDKMDPITRDPLLIWDYSHPGAQAYITSVMKNARENWGVDYFKIDFMRQGLYKGVNHLPVTNVERYRMGMAAMKKGIGNAYFLACSPNFGVNIGFTDASRTGPDIDPSYDAVKIRAEHNSGSYYFAGKLFNCDPDYVVLRSKAESNERDGKKPSLTAQQGQMWANYVSIYGNVRLESDELSLLPEDKKKIIKTNFQLPFFVKTIPMDLWDHCKTESDAPMFYLAKGRNGEVCLGLFNWGDTAQKFTVSGFAKGGKFMPYLGGERQQTKGSELMLSLNGVTSVLLRYQGSQSFEELAKSLKLTVQ